MHNKSQIAPNSVLQLLLRSGGGESRLNDGHLAYYESGACLLEAYLRAICELLQLLSFSLSAVVWKEEGGGYTTVQCTVQKKHFLCGNVLLQCLLCSLP